MDENAISLVDTDEPAFALELVKYFLNILDHPLTINTLQKLKVIRDKSIAHNEQCTEIQGPAWLELERLIQHAKEFAGILRWAYFSTVYMHDGNYILTSDAERPSRALNRLLRQIIPMEKAPDLFLGAKNMDSGKSVGWAAPTANLRHKTLDYWNIIAYA